MADAQPRSAGSAFPLWPSERPSTAQIIDWFKLANAVLTPTHRALIAGVDPSTVAKFKSVSVLPPLIAGGDVTAAMVASREQYRQSQMDQNARFQDEKRAAMSELSTGLFALIEAALQDNAPLLLISLKEKCKQVDPYDMLSDGKAAWEELVAMGGVDAMLPGEDAAYEAELTALALKPLPAGATHDEFSQRVNHALKNIMPYVERPYTPYQLGLWVTRQTPVDQYQEALKRFNALTKTQQENPHGVAAMIVKLMAENRNPLEIMKTSKLGEVIATLSDEGILVGSDDTAPTPATGRRPPGMGKGKGGKGSGGGGKGSGGGRGDGSGKGAGRGGRGGASSTSGAGRATSCSVAPPRGPMCDKAHHGPCWRDPANAGPFPWRVWSDEAVMKSIKADRIANGRRTGEEVLEIVPATKPVSEVVAVLDDDDLQQWPSNLDDGEDVPPEVIAVVDVAALPAPASAPAADAVRPVEVAPATVPVEVAPAAAPVAAPPAAGLITDAQRLRAANNRADALHTLHRTQLAGAQQAQARAEASEAQLRAEVRALQQRVEAQQCSGSVEGGAAATASVLEVPMGAPVEPPVAAPPSLTYHHARRAVELLTPQSSLAEIKRVALEAGLRVPLHVGGGSPSRTPGQSRNRRDILIEARQELHIETPADWGLPAPRESPAASLTSAAPPSDLVRAVYTLRVIGSGGDVPNLDKITSSSLSGARRTLRDHGAEFAHMAPGMLKCAAWVMQYASPPRDAAAVRYVSDLPQRRHALGLIRLRLLELADARDGPRDFGNYEFFVTALDDVARAYHAAVVESKLLYEENGGDHADADHAALVLSGSLSADVAFLAPLRPAPESPEGIALDVSERLHAAAAPYARLLVYAIAALVLASFHSSFEALWAVLVVLAAHAYVYVAGGHGGAELDYDFNVSLFQMTTNPHNVLEQAAQGNALASGIMASFVVLLFYYRHALARASLRLWRLAVRGASETTMLVVLLIFIWVCVWKASAAEVPSDVVRLQRRLLPEIAERAALHPSPANFVRLNINIAHGLGEIVYGAVLIDFEPPDELVAILGATGAAAAKVWDSGSRRHVVRNRARFVAGTVKPCNFRIRGINTGGHQPECMGDVDEYFPLRGGDVVTHRLRDAVLIEDAPHDIIGAGLLQAEGLCDWRGILPDGREIYLENHRFLLMPDCPRDQRTHDHDSKANGVMFVGGGPGTGARSPPFIEQRHKTAVSDVPPTLDCATSTTLLYWFSGTNLTETGVRAQWHALTKGDCVYRDVKLDENHSLLCNEVYEKDMRAIRDGTITRGLFAVPCGTFSVARFRNHPRIRVLRESGRHILGLPDLNAADSAAVRVANILVERTCAAVHALATNGGLWIVENPVRRNDPDGPWRRFNSGKFPKHGSLWQMPSILDIARDWGARVVHVPLCWFEHNNSDVSEVEQKYLTLMYSPRLEPALAFLRRTRCSHRAHKKQAVGFDEDGVSLGAATSTYPAELNRILARALACPDRCASDEAWHAVDVLASVDVTDPVTDVPPQGVERGITGDRRADGAGATLARGHTVNMRQLSSRQVHEMFVHKPADVLRLLPTVCGDVPSEWEHLQDLNDSCPDCLAGKHTHFGTHSSLPEVTSPGEIIAFDLLILRTPDLFTGGTIVFGAIDLYSDWDVVIKIKFKTDVPECMKEVVRVFKAYGHDVQRLHTDGEAVFHSDEAFEAVKSELKGIGCLITTGADYDHRQNSKIERHFRRLGDDARPGFLQSGLDDRFYQCALVDASAKHKLLPLARAPGASPTTLMTGKPGMALPQRPFGTLGYVMLEHELNDSTVKLNKAHARAEPGILLSYGVTGVLRDRRVPAWVLYVPSLRRTVPFVTPHCSVVLGCYPGVDGLRVGLSNVLRDRSVASDEHAVHLDAADDGTVTVAEHTLVPKATPSVVPPSPAETAVDDTHHAEPIAPSSPTIAQRLSRRTVHPHEGSNRVGAALDFDAAADDSVLCLETHPHDLRSVLDCSDLHAAAGGTGPPAAFAPTLGEAPWLTSPGGGGCNSKTDEEILVADLDVEATRREEMVFLCDDSASDEIRGNAGVHRHVTQEAPRRIVRFPWGDVPSPWIENYSTIYETGIDDSVFVLDECILTSLNDDDDPTWEQAIASNDRQDWYAAADQELDNLERFEVFKLVPADSVPCDEDIFDLMLLCKKKRGQDNVCIKSKVRCVLCGNQVVQSAKRGQSKTTVDLRTHSPAIRAASLKTNFAVGVLDDLRMLDFDVDAAYLQGRYVDRRVFARAPKYYRRYDERGVELVWHLQRALYGGPDSGRVWYNTFAHFLMEEEREVPFKRCHFEPCTFTHFRDGLVDQHGHPQRIILSVYVDDGRTWDNCPEVCDAFYERLKSRFSITMGGAEQFMIGMDISLGKGWLKICSSTYIRNLCARWLQFPIDEYDYVGTPAHPKLCELYETAFLTRGNTPPELATRYRSLVGALIFPAPTTRPDCLFTVGILARAMDCATEDMFKAALYCLVFMGQTHKDGITYVRDAPGGRRYVHYADSDWATRRSTTGGTGQLAGGSTQARASKQDCVTGSSTHSEIVSASTNSNDVVWSRGYLGELGLPQDDEPTPFYVDAANVITLVHNLISSKATRHITRRECVVREREADGTLVVTKINTNDNLADLFTKALARDPFSKLRKLVMNILAQGAIAPVPRARRIAASRGA